MELRANKKSDNAKMTNAKLLQRLAAICETPVVPSNIVEALTSRRTHVRVDDQMIGQLNEIEREAGSVADILQRLEALHSIQPFESTLL